MSGALDTSVLVQLVTAQTPKLADAAVQMVERADGQLAIADAAIIELVFVLDKVKKLERQDIATTIQVLAGHKKLNFNRALFAKALPDYVAHPGLSIHDCCLAAYAGLSNARPLWTFDQALARQSPSAKLVASK